MFVWKSILINVNLKPATGCFERILCPELHCLLTICKRKGQTTTLRHNVARFMFWWQFFRRTGTIHLPLLFGNTHSRSTAERYGSPKLCGVVAQVRKYAHGHLAIPIGHGYIYNDMTTFVHNTMSHLPRLHCVGIIDLSI